MLAAGAGLVVRADRQADRAEAGAARRASRTCGARRYAEAAEATRGGEALLEGRAVRRAAPRPAARETDRAADRARAAAELHALCEQVRPLYAADALPANEARTALEHCRNLWAVRADIADRLADQPTPELEARWRSDLLDLGVLTAYLEVRAGGIPERARHSDRGRGTARPQRRTLPGAGPDARALGQLTDADVAEERAAEFPPRTAWEFLAVGRARLAAGDPAGAAAALDRCLESDPRSVWGNYFRGVCALKLNQPTEAVAAFSACLCSTPKAAWCLYNRGLAFAGTGRTDRATADLDLAAGPRPVHRPGGELLARLRRN